MRYTKDWTPADEGIAAAKKEARAPRVATPAELGEQAAKKEYEAYHTPTNFDTIKETKEEMKKVATDCEKNMGELLNAVQAIANGKDPAREIDLQNKYGLTFDGWADVIRNNLGLLWEYRNDINTLEGRGQTEEQTPANAEYFSENLADYR